MSCGELQLPSELLALAINLAFDEAAAEVLGETLALAVPLNPTPIPNPNPTPIPAPTPTPAQVLGEAGVLRHCLERLLQTQDVLLLKLLRGLAAHEGPARL